MPQDTGPVLVSLAMVKRYLHWSKTTRTAINPHQIAKLPS